MRRSVLWGMLVLILDRVSKLLAQSMLVGGSLEIIPGVLAFTYAQNTGMAFSLFSGYPRLLALLSVVLLLGVAFFMRRMLPGTRISDALLGALIGGGVGNLIDRLAYGYVIDFIELRFIRFAIFNVADMAVSISAMLLMVLCFLDHTNGEGAEHGRGKGA